MNFIVLFYTILFHIDVIHCCIFITFTIAFVMEGLLRGLAGYVVMPRMRRKGGYVCIITTAVLYMITVELENGVSRIR